MKEIILRGHKVAKGRAQGEALVSKTPVSFLGSVNPETGMVVEEGHELNGSSIADKILIFPIGKGSTAGSYQLYELAYHKKAPKAIINIQADPVVAVGAIISKIPMVDKLEQNPLEMIKTGDTVEVDADQGIVKVSSQSN
jgi:predicted aconitase with swiveling domain